MNKCSVPVFGACVPQATWDVARLRTYSSAKKISAQNYYFGDCIHDFLLLFISVGLCYGSSQTKHSPSDQSN